MEVDLELPVVPFDGRSKDLSALFVSLKGIQCKTRVFVALSEYSEMLVPNLFNTRVTGNVEKTGDKAPCRSGDSQLRVLSELLSP